ncbi:MAG TPA: hypothetical protein VGN57_17660 [Pirellulaceae bacterium]|jgi:hypothetical protein|nr:hypothetical protein [Pirellulaceae bacterium]
MAWALALGVTASLGWCQSPERRPPEIMDVALGADGSLQGKTLTGPQNAVQAFEQVDITWEGRVVATAKSDRDGNFEVRGLKGGVHVISVGERQQVCRFWTSETAPPHSVRGVAFVENTQTVVRGQNDKGIWGYVKNNPGRVAFDGILLGTSATALVVALDAKDSSD